MKYLIKDTTKEERKKIAKKAFGISIASNEMPSDDTIKLVKKYIDGECELKEIQEKEIEKYRRKR